MVKTAYWFRYTEGGGHRYAAVVADSLEECFDKLERELGADPLEATYLNRSFDVVE